MIASPQRRAILGRWRRPSRPTDSRPPSFDTDGTPQRSADEMFVTFPVLAYTGRIGGSVGWWRGMVRAGQAITYDNGCRVVSRFGCHDEVVRIAGSVETT